MSILEATLTAFILVTVVLIGLVMLRPSLTRARGGRVLAFLVFFILPVVALWGGTSAHLEQSKSTSFCLSCHVMEPYGQSLNLDDTDYLPAGHFQQNRVEREHACYTCHTSYTLFGGMRSKMQGLQHLFVNYLGSVPEKIELYQPYNNRECLHCHEQARTFEENEIHAEIRSELESSEASCLECHDLVHNIANLDSLEMWQPGETP